jgi:alpha-beta hydrolase superfamily lysophospholipase
MSNVFPGLLVNNSLKSEDLSRDLRIVHEYRNDKLVHDRISLKMFNQIYYAGINVSMNIYKINVPLLVMHGNADNITSCKTTREFVRNASNKTTYIEWENGYHELHNDLDKEKVFDSLLDWLNQQAN